MYKGNFLSTRFSKIDKEFVSQNRISRHDCSGPEDRLDTKVDQIDLCHISMYVRHLT
jgi:hypothetical protein